MNIFKTSIFLVILTFSHHAFAACSTPAGNAGDVIYETNNNVMQYCNGTNWVNAGSKNAAAGSAGCTSPVANEGALTFDTNTGLYMFCNGEDWMNVTCGDNVTTGGGGCSSPSGKTADIIYNSSANKLQFCDSTSWVNFGSGCTFIDSFTFIKAIGGAGTDYAYDIAYDSENNILITGQTNSDGSGSNEIPLIKIDANGNFLWTKMVGGNDSDVAKSIVIDNSGNIYLAGSLYNSSASDRDALIIKLDSNANVLWHKTIGDNNADGSAEKITLDSSGNIYVVGDIVNDGESGNNDVLVMKLDSSSNILWDKRISGTSSDYGKDITVDSSGNVYIAGQTSSDGAGNYDILLFKLDNSGNILWDKTIGGTANDLAKKIILGTDGYIYVAGETGSDGAGVSDVFVVKLDSSGNIIWDKTIGGTIQDEAYAMTLDSNNNIYLTGQTSSDGNGSFDILLMKLDNGGNLLWSKTIGNAGSETAYAITYNNGFLYITARTNSVGAGSYDILITKITSDGEINSSCSAWVSNADDADTIADGNDADTIDNADNADTIASSGDAGTIADSNANNVADADDADTVTEVCSGKYNL